jgi:PAS domain S-box-containing protein
MSSDGNTLLYVSPSVEVMWGIPAEKLYQNLSLFFQVIHPDDRERVAEARKQAIGSEFPGIEYRIIRDDGSLRWIFARIFSIKDETQKIVRIAGVMEDITDRKEAEIALREGEERFREFADNIGSIFWMVTPDAKTMLYVSPAYETIWGRPYQEVYENPMAFADAIHPDDREAVLQDRTERLLKGLYNVEYRIIRPDGEVRWVASRGYPIKRQGEIYRIVGITEDITTRKELEKQTFDMTLEREYGRVLANFVRDTSHDLRTPLTIMTTGLYLLRRTDDPQKRIQRIDTLETQVKHLHKVVNDLQTMANLDVSIDLNESLVNVNQLVQSVVDLYSPRIAEHGHRIDWRPGENIAPIEADAGELRHALSNLFDNAILFTPPGNGVITVTTSETLTETAISVGDNGIGIDERHVDDIFERFYKVDAARPSGKSGPGLGLTMARKIIEMHGGRIEVASIPGQGSTFKICLPSRIRFTSPDPSKPHD